MKKEEILKNITDDDTRKAVEQVLNFATAQAMEAAQTKASPEDVQAAIDKKIGDLNIEVAKVRGLQEQLDNIGKSINKIEEGKQKDQVIPLRKSLESLEGAMKDLHAASSGKMSMTLNLKHFLNEIHKTTVTASSLNNDTTGLRLLDIGQLATIRMKLASLFAQFPMGADHHRTIYYTDWSTATRNAASRTPGNAAAESVAEWTGYTAPLESVSDSIPVHKEALSSVSWMETEIRNFILNNLLLEEDRLLATGTGTPPQIKGIYTYATAFDSAAYSGYKPERAALMDLIAVMATEIMKNTQYNVDVCLVNPADMLGLILEKDANGNRINFPIVNPLTGDAQIKQVRVIETPSIAQNTLVLGDFTKARRYFGENITLEWGYNLTGDFTKRIITLMGNMEETLLVRTCEQNAFLKSTNVETDISNINAVIS
jgi:hypothetical protein